MKLAIMQPYFFPYIGYFQLVHSVDKFIIYDDVNFIKKGWINRNNILLNGEKHTFTLPLKKVSQNKKINEIELSDDTKSKNKILQTIEHGYKKAPNYLLVLPLIEEILNHPNANLSSFLYHSIKSICKYLEINTEIIPSSSIYNNQTLSGPDRIVSICQKEDCTTYINAIGGKELYNSLHFNELGIELKFLKTKEFSYLQIGDNFTSHLSIIDNLMFQNRQDLMDSLNQFELIN